MYELYARTPDSTYLFRVGADAAEFDKAATEAIVRSIALTPPPAPVDP